MRVVAVAAATEPSRWRRRGAGAESTSASAHSQAANSTSIKWCRDAPSPPEGLCLAPQLAPSRQFSRVESWCAHSAGPERRPREKDGGQVGSKPQAGLRWTKRRREELEGDGDPLEGNPFFDCHLPLPPHTANCSQTSPVPSNNRDDDGRCGSSSSNNLR